MKWFAQRNEWQSQFIFNQAYFRQCCLNACGIVFNKKQFVSFNQSVIYFFCFFQISLQRGADQLVEPLGMRRFIDSPTTLATNKPRRG